MINKVILIGNLGRDPEVRHLESNVAVAKFPIATNESYKDKSGEWQTLTEWHDIVAWRNLAERAERDLKKGSLVYVEGKLTHRKYQDKDGIERYITEIVANTIRPLEKRENTGRNYNESFPSALDQPISGGGLGSFDKTKESMADNAPDIVEDDLPF